MQRTEIILTHFTCFTQLLRRWTRRGQRSALSLPALGIVAGDRKLASLTDVWLFVAPD